MIRRRHDLLRPGRPVTHARGISWEVSSLLQAPGDLVNVGDIRPCDTGDDGAELRERQHSLAPALWRSLRNNGEIEEAKAVMRAREWGARQKLNPPKMSGGHPPRRNRAYSTGIQTSKVPWLGFLGTHVKFWTRTRAGARPSPRNEVETISLAISVADLSSEKK
jgi:hypothetical protein